MTTTTCPQERVRIDDARCDSAYAFVTSQCVPVWPGGCERYVFRHIASGDLWAKDVIMDDDSSWEGVWYAVKAQVVTEYVPARVPSPPRQRAPVVPRETPGPSLADIVTRARKNKETHL